MPASGVLKSIISFISTSMRGILAKNYLVPGRTRGPRQPNVLHRIAASATSNKRHYFPAGQQRLAHPRFRMKRVAIVGAASPHVPHHEISPGEFLLFFARQATHIVLAVCAEDQVARGAQYPPELLHPRSLQVVRHVRE